MKLKQSLLITIETDKETNETVIARKTVKLNTLETLGLLTYGENQILLDLFSTRKTKT